MASISSLGIGGGILTSELADQLVDVERQVADKRLDAQEEFTNAEISEFGALKGLVEGFDSAVSALNLASSFKNNTSSSSDESSLTGTVSSVASPGLYSVEVDQLAQAQTLASMEFSELDDIVGEGTFTFTFGEVQTTTDANRNVTSFDSFITDTEQAVKTLKIDATNHTVSGVRDAINAADLGVQATIVDTGSGYRLLLQSESTGKTNGFTIGVSNATNGLDDFDFNAGSVGAGLLHTTDAVDSEFNVNGLSITREDNLVAGVINGVTLNLKQTTSDPINFSVERDTAAVTEKMNSFVSSYNELKSKINELTDYNEDDGIGSIFIGDATVRNLQTQLQGVLGGVVESLVGSEFRTLSEVGFATNKDSGLLEFNSSTFSDLLRTQTDDMGILFGKTGSAADSQITFLGGSNSTVAGDYDILISQLATQGKFEGNTTSGSFVINDQNDTFKINVNGSYSETIELVQGAYTGAEMAEHLQAQINADESLQGDGRAVNVAYDSGDKAFTITSSSYGSLSSVNFNFMESALQDTLGLYVPGQGPRSLDSSSSLATVDTLSSSLLIDDSNDDFSLTVAGLTSNSIELPNATYTDGSDLASALQAAINADGNFSSGGVFSTVRFVGDQENGKLEITFNNDETYSVASSDAGLAAALGITTGLSDTSEVTSLAMVDDFSSARVIDASNNEFSLLVNGRESNVITIASGSYSDGASLAAAVEAAIAADTLLQGLPAQAAQTEPGTLDIAATGLDFNATNRGFLLTLNGTEMEVLVNQDATTDLNGDLNVGDVDDNLFAIQAALDTALTDAGLGAGDIVASQDANGLVLTTLATGITEALVVNADLVSPKTAVGTTVLAGAEDYTALADPTLVLDVDGTAVNVDLQPLTGGVTPEDTLANIQSELDTGLVAAGLLAGDVEARLDASDQVYFYNVKDKGAAETLSITSVGADDPLGLTPIVGTVYNGADGFGLPTGQELGVEAEADYAAAVSVTFEGGETSGNLKIDFGNSATFTVTEAETAMAVDLGIAVSDGTETDVIKGLDVVGTINGVAAKGTGQLLVGASNDDSEGLRMEVNGGPLGKRGNVSFVRGIADRLDSLLENLLSGSLNNKTVSLQKDLAEIAEERTALNTRIDSFRARLEKQFLRNDIIVSQLNSTQDYLKTQFEVLNAIYSNKK